MKFYRDERYVLWGRQRVAAAVVGYDDHIWIVKAVVAERVGIIAFILLYQRGVAYWLIVKSLVHHRLWLGNVPHARSLENELPSAVIRAEDKAGQSAEFPWTGVHRDVVGIPGEPLSALVPRRGEAALITEYGGNAVRYGRPFGRFHGLGHGVIIDARHVIEERKAAVLGIIAVHLPRNELPKRDSLLPLAALTALSESLRNAA